MCLPFIKPDCGGPALSGVGFLFEEKTSEAKNKPVLSQYQSLFAPCEHKSATCGQISAPCEHMSAQPEQRLQNNKDNIRAGSINRLAEPVNKR